jgi:hypothetical protein
MRDDDYETRRIPPVLRRIMLLLAVIAAVPVVLWAITVFVRAYVAPPKVPTFRPVVAATTVTQESTVALAPAAAPRALAASIAESKPSATKAPKTEATDAGSPPASDSQPPIVTANALPSNVRSAAPSPPEPPPVAPAPMAQEAAAALPPQPPAPPADELPLAGEPIAGPVPLPPQRPRVFAMVPGPIPVPRPRPDVPEQAATPPIEVDLTIRDYMH